MLSQEELEVPLAMCDRAPHSGAPLQEDLASIAPELASPQDTADHDASRAAGGAAMHALVAPERFCAELQAWCTSEHGVACAALETVITEAAALGGSAAIMECLQAARQQADQFSAHAMWVHEHRHSADAALAERTAQDLFAVCRCALRCTRALSADDTYVAEEMPVHLWTMLTELQRNVTALREVVQDNGNNAGSLVLAGVRALTTNLVHIRCRPCAREKAMQF